MELHEKDFLNLVLLENVLERFNMLDAKPTSILISDHLLLCIHHLLCVYILYLVQLECKWKIIKYFV